MTDREYHEWSLRKGLRAGRCLLAALAALIVLAGCGKRDVAKQADASGLWVSRYSINFDGDHDVTRVLAEVSNGGDKPVKVATVTAILRGPTGENRGENRKVLRNLQPGKRRVFSINVTSHGEEHSVEFRIEPGDKRESEADKAGKGAERDSGK